MKSTLIINSDGTKVWCLNGQFHREDGPAIEHPDGTKVWCLNGQRHREDGPAIEDSDDGKSWWLNGRQLFEEELLSKRIQKNYSDLHNSYLIYQIMES